jgi:two-component system, chemotaxis family, CheB/CheR fusion protein
VTLVLQDIDTLKRHAVSLESARNYAETIIETVQIPLVVLDADLRVNTANRSFYETFQVSEAETIHMLLFELGSGQWNIPLLRSMLNGILADELSVQDFEVNHDFEQIGQKNMLLNARKNNSKRSFSAPNISKVLAPWLVVLPTTSTISSLPFWQLLNCYLSN